MQSRLQFSVDNLTNLNQNTSAAQSQIQDTDYAEAMVALYRERVLSQAGVAMMAHQNQNSQNVLSLLR